MSEQGSRPESEQPLTDDQVDQLVSYAYLSGVPTQEREELPPKLKAVWEAEQQRLGRKPGDAL